MGVFVAPRANAQLPDLAVTSVYWTGQPVAGQSFMVTMVVTNFGPGAASGGWIDEWVLSTSSSLTNAVANVTLQLGRQSHSIAPNASYTNTQTWTLSGVPSGQFYVIGFADVFNNLVESDESNNTLAVPITLAIPDLAVTSVTFSGEAVVGQPLTVSMVVTNIGSGFANGAWYDEFVLSSSPSLADAVPGGTFNFTLSHTVPTNGSYTVNQNITLPAVPVGQYYLIGVADDQNNVEESTYANNTQAVPITLAAPDLAVASVSWAGQPVAGQLLALTLVVTNIGSGFASGEHYDAFILSSNATLAGEVPNGRFLYATSQS
ncbi:MAG TPA: CARDB domain-containing protein, partial [Verrucomicrobiae bacterium]